MTPLLSVEKIEKSFGAVPVLKDISFTVGGGEIFFLLGPSGCGKTTLLRILNGFTVPDAGRILLDGRDITPEPPQQRHIGMVFQNYALWPHMTVHENIAYGLRVVKTERREIAERVERILKIARLDGLGNRHPSELSGGQQQRVALCRSLVVEPKILLLDEPLSNLDASLREELRDHLRMIRNETGITMIYVTHDKGDALAIADRIAVMETGTIMRIVTPEVFARQ